METKRKEKEKKEEKKRKEAKKKRYCMPRFELGPFGAPGESLTTRPRATSFVEVLLLKPSSLIKHEFKDIFQKNDCSLNSEYPA